MRRIALTASLIAFTVTCAPLVAAKTKTASLPSASAVQLSVSVSDDLAHRADNLPKDRRNRGRARNSRDGWSGNGFYGQKDIDYLKAEVREELTDDFSRYGITVSDTAAYTLKVTLVDADPTRPTFRQLSKQPGLSRQSLANGGAQLRADMYDASGALLGTLDYDWHETSLRDNIGASTWSDARRAISRFARKTAKTISVKAR